MTIDLERILKDIETLATFNATPGNGVTRLPFTKEDKLARDYISKEMEKIGLKVWEDGYSNLFGRREGENPDLPVIMIGSHFDTVINGGLFDGIAGVAASLEILRVFQEKGIKNYFPIEIVAMNDEEGVRFGTGISNSRAMAGLIEEEELDNMRDRDGISLREAMTKFGVMPNLENAKRPKNSVKAFIELHIEQGPILEYNKKNIGLVETIVGLDRYKVKFRGKSGHVGTTPMDNRKDALVAAAEFILAVNKIAKEAAGETVGTVGELSLSPNATNVIPGYVELSVDVRSISEEKIKRVYKKLSNKIETIERDSGVDIEMTKELYIAPVGMSKEFIDIMIENADKLGFSYMRMNSGAGHDAMIMAGITSASLIFVPSKDGLSHHPDEWTEYEDLKKGIEVMLNTVAYLCMKSNDKEILENNQGK